MSDEERVAAARFKAATWGKPCAVCGVWSTKAHHVVEADWLRRHHKPVYDIRNALPVCEHDHANHHSTRRIPLSALTEDNLAFAVEVLGEAADHYLRRRYRDG